MDNSRIFQFCTGTRKAASKQPAKITYIRHVQPIVSSTCSPCHISPKGNKKPCRHLASAKDEIDEMIRRIQKNPGDKGFMPFKHPKNYLTPQLMCLYNGKQMGCLKSNERL